MLSCVRYPANSAGPGRSKMYDNPGGRAERQAGLSEEEREKEVSQGQSG